MNRIRTVLAALGLAAGLAAAPAANAAPQHEQRPAAAPSPHEPCTGKFHDDARLGPEWLPNKQQKPVGPLLKGYQRTGKLSPDAFLKKYWEGPAGTGSWKYPPNDGFGEVNGKVDKKPTKLRTGERLDRFGSEYGGYLAPAGDPYAKRALPPQNLNTRDAAVPCDYHVYKVTKPFQVWQGGIAPWFEQPGKGQQIKLDPVFLDPGQGERLNVKWLLEHGYLQTAA
ncbi:MULTISPECIES: TNT domain-containing protein [Streptomyces]|uniref:TNT domain-containing protein n=1 Tax=Streptomyces TaxID=1883 RepID=UPI00069AD9BE|nr:TNT domain-containing protein [Streptomyces kasugaensis]MYU50470.1 glycohydrolase toxin TNT-related protein [Streptomyces sp. SID7805]